MNKPSWNLLTTPGRYVPAIDTDIRKTFARIRAEQERAATMKAISYQAATVRPLRKASK